MKAHLQKYAATSVPRYTSYPTAPHFQAGFSEQKYRGWLESLDPTRPISLYLHVPFCRQMCWYCGCNMKLAARYDPVAEYTENLLREIELITDILPSNMKISHLHWGGGTPTALEPDDLKKIMSRLFSKFSLIDGAELAIESDPRTLTNKMCATIGELGFTRASFGVQEFDPVVQSAINRVQPPEMVHKVVRQLREAGVRGINFDLIYGLPFQTTQTLQKTIDQCVEMSPDRIALFGYAHVPWMAKNQRMIDENALPNSQQRHQQADAAAEKLQERGYSPIGLDHFALPEDGLFAAMKNGELHRNFQGYTTDTAQTILGLGATSIGRTPFGYIQNITETGAWAREVNLGRLPIAKGCDLTPEDKLRAEVIERIMCYGAVDLDEVSTSHAAPANCFDASAGKLAEFMNDGLLEFEGSTLRLTPAGLPLSRVIASAFDAYRTNKTVKHSLAI